MGNAFDKFPRPDEIPWDRIKEVRVSKDGEMFSFEFDIYGKKQKMTIAVKPGTTSFTLSKDDGKPIVHADQKGADVNIIDFTRTPSKLPGWVKGMQKKPRHG